VRKEGTRRLTTILEAKMPQHQGDVHDLFAEYLRWVCPKINEEYKIIFDAESMIVRDMQKIEVFMPPNGILLIAFDDGQLAGCACMRKMEEGIAELKRMFVRPGFRKKGIGGALVKQAIGLVRDQGYAILRLDSARFMSDAHALYRSFGFKDIQPYEGSEIPAEYRKHWVFMELQLRASQ
jgi:GNAT superfamily N-acetyltransferase